MREMLLIGGWTENSNNGDAAWASALNLLASVAAGANGFEVSAGSPRVVYSPGGIFTSGMVGAVLSLFATVHEQNRGMWKIVEYIDVNHVKVDPVSFSPFGWVDETGMAARVVVGNGLRLTNGAWVLMDAPAGSNMQVRILCSDNTNSVAYVYPRPKGKIGVATETGTVNLAMGATITTMARLNFYFDGTRALMYWLTDDLYTGLCVLGALLDTDVADANPNCMYASRDITATWPWNYTGVMLDGIDAAILMYPTTVKPFLAADDGESFEVLFNRRLVNGRPGFAAMRSPWVVLANTVNVGACARGRLPLVRFSYVGWEKLTPLDTPGSWLHLHLGMVVPRNGPNDRMVIYP